MYEITFALIKPDAVEKGYVGQIITEMEREFYVTDVVCSKWNRSLVEQFYAEHQGKPFFDDLVGFMSRGRMYAVGLVAENAVAKWRTMMGATDPKKAEPDSIRGQFGSKDGPMMHNAVHGSATREDVRREFDLVRFAMLDAGRKASLFGTETVRIHKAHGGTSF